MLKLPAMEGHPGAAVCNTGLQHLWQKLYPAEDIDWAHFQFLLVANSTLILPGFLGSTLRGAFGNIFRDMVCSTRLEDCRACPLVAQCAFPRYFMTAPLPGQPLQKLQDVPRPYVFRVDPPSEGHRTVFAEEMLPFGLLLFGNGIEAFPYFLNSFRELAQRGLGKKRGGASLHRVDLLQAGSPVPIYSRERPVIHLPTTVDSWSRLLNRLSSCPDRRELRLRFLTPVRFKVDSQWHEPEQELTFAKYMRVLLRRLSSVWGFAGDFRLDWDFASILQRAENVRTTFQSLRRLPWQRHSSRTDHWTELGGLVGEVCYQGNLDEFAPLVEMGSLVHLGKNTTFGLGHYQATWRHLS